MAVVRVEEAYSDRDETIDENAAQSLRGNQMEQRMLTATQEIVKHTKKTAELLKDGAGGGSMTFQ